jgi:hypothetical protein
LSIRFFGLVLFTRANIKEVDAELVSASFYLKLMAVDFSTKSVLVFKPGLLAFFILL